jgi:quinol monooxygenase YgiN
MSPHVLTVVSAVVAEEGRERLIAGFRELVAGPMPDGLLRTELLQGAEGRWRIQTLWRDQEALEAMRAGPEPPAAPALFRRVGSKPSLEIWAVADSGP